MRIFAVSDLHIDYDENQQFVDNLSFVDHTHDVLVLAGDVSDKMQTLEKTFQTLKKRFKEVLYVPGNHDLWVARSYGMNSLEKFSFIIELGRRVGKIAMFWNGKAIHIRATQENV